jgi:hypothetical protein
MADFNDSDNPWLKMGALDHGLVAVRRALNSTKRRFTDSRPREQAKQTAKRPIQQQQGESSHEAEDAKQQTNIALGRFQLCVREIVCQTSSSEGCKAAALVQTLDEISAERGSCRLLGSCTFGPDSERNLGRTWLCRRLCSCIGTDSGCNFYSKGCWAAALVQTLIEKSTL